MNLKPLSIATLVFFLHSQANSARPKFVPGEYVVKLRSSAFLKKAMSNRVALTAQLNNFVKSVIPNQQMVVIQRASFENVESAIAALKQNPLIEIAEPNYFYYANRSPSDAFYFELWGMKNTGQKDYTGQPGLVGVDISVEKAWDIETGSPNVIVGVIDSGIDYENSDLTDNMWTNQVEAGGTLGVDDDNNGYIDDIHGYNFDANNSNPYDDNDHGTHCAGTIGAKGNDGKGVSGVVWDVQLMALKFLDKNGVGSLENAIRAIDYSVQMGARIISNSWGGVLYSELLKQAIERANEAGVLFVVAAGNDSNDNDAYPTYPSTYDVPNVLSVAAIDNRGIIAPFSSYGKKTVHVAAPGVQVFSTTPGGFKALSGTSMATPHVSGIAALLASHEPLLTNLQIKERIITTSRPLRSLVGKVSSDGIVDAFAALTNDTSPLPDPNDPTLWNSYEVAVSSSHPYSVDSTEVFDVVVPLHARQIAIYFARFEVEVGYDMVEIFDSEGVRFQKLAGSYLKGVVSSIVEGNKAHIVLTSDRSITKHGFDISKVFWR